MAGRYLDDMVADHLCISVSNIQIFVRRRHHRLRGGCLCRAIPEAFNIRFAMQSGISYMHGIPLSA